MDAVISQQLATAELITNFMNNTKKAGKQSLTKGYYEVRRTLLEKYWSRIVDGHEEIISNKKDPAFAAYLKDDIYSTIELNYATTLGSLLDLLEAFQPPSAAVPDAGAEESRRTPQAVKLPAIVIPKFSGDFSTWTSFHDLFDSLVIKNNALSNVNKLHHLKAAVIGEAELVLRPFAIEDQNFEPAWQLLKRRFANKRMLINSQFSKILSHHKTNNDADSIRHILNISTESINSIKSLIAANQQFDSLIIYILTQKMDVKTIEEWEHSLPNNVNDIPTLDQFHAFLENLCRMQDLVKCSTKSSEQKYSKGKQDHARAIKSLQTSSSGLLCMCCNKPNHVIFKCHKFRALPVSDRLKCVSTKGLCIRCLSSQHKFQDCPQSWLCSTCNKPHNNLLHQPSTNNEDSSSGRDAQTRANVHATAISNPEAQCETSINAHHSADLQLGHTLLATAQVSIQSKYGQTFLFRALIDPGSESCFISRAAVALLQLPLKKINAQIHAVGGKSVGTSRQLLTCTITSIHNSSAAVAIDAVVMPTLTNAKPPRMLQSTTWAHLQDLQLADPRFNVADKIDLILGADTYYDVFLPDIRKGPRGSPSAQNTIFGYILIGKIGQSQIDSNLLESQQINCNLNEISVCEQLRKFWEMEEVCAVPKLTAEDEQCELHYQRTTSRNKSGRYCVDLPFNTCDGKPPKFGNTKHQAILRLYQVEKRLQNNAELKAQYNAFIDEYLRLGHMKVVQESDKRPRFYLPHHAIIRPSSLSTKLRVVFDASAKDSCGRSLNNTLLTGPTIQEDLMDILLRWRKHRFAITGDAEKMYRQIDVNYDHQPYQCILWRDANQKLIEYDLTTVTYGTACAPFLAIRTIHQLANDEKLNYPVAAERTLKDMYVDDFISGADTIEEAATLQNDMVQLFKSGGFNLRKWSSNSPEIISSIPATTREVDTCLDVCRDDVVKTLGIMWHTVEDEFYFVVIIPEEPNVLSKRTLLSDVAKLYDPLGFLAPIIISAKILFQPLWLKGLDWDDPLPEDIAHDWITLRSKLSNISKIRIPRWIGTFKTNIKIEFHGFCDASIKAYAAVIYCRTEENGKYQIQLLTSKTRVAPIKQVSLPNLELCGATLLAKLMKRVIAAMDLKVDIVAWTDSTIVLDWIRSNVHKKTFVANRVTTILENTKPNHWRHIRSKDNPADIASRGICASQLPDHALWWHGPPWLRSPESDWPELPIKPSKGETHLIVTTTEIAVEFSAVLERFSNIDTMIRVIARCLRFIRSCRTKTKPATNWLSAAEHRQARNLIIQNVQQSSYSEEMHSIKKSSDISKSKIASLSPFICEEGFLRVGGRLNNAKLSYDQKHQILLPHNNNVTKLIITNIHTIKTLHGGLKITLSTLRQQYWVPNARTLIRHIIHRCIKCHRYASHCKEQIMSVLPAARVTQSKVFSHTGVDFAGPFNIRLSSHRGRGTFKGFVSVFVCMATKAIHLELASDLSSNTFLAAFKRFVSRRGPCSDVYSDNGTNFVGANRALMTKFDEVMTEISTDAAKALAIHGTTWHFIPANSPHFGGLWEAAVKSFKFHFKRIIGQQVLTYEEFYTLLTEIEAVLNSRPLCNLSTDPNDTEALTPGHFLTGGPLNSVPEPSLLNIAENRLQRWQLLVKMNQDFWRSWSKDYLTELQQRPKKWRKAEENLQVGDIVIIKDNRYPPANWLLARVTQTHPGEDGVVRVITVQHKTGEMKRAVNRVCRLPIDRK